MLKDLDAALSGYLTAETLPGQPLRIELEPPTKEWAARRSGAVLNLFMADIREDLERRTANPRAIRNDSGFVIARQNPPRYFAITYLLTAWTTTPEDDHHLLGQALLALLKYDYIPLDYVKGELAAFIGADFPIHIRVGGKTFTERMVTELMTAIGGDYRPTISILCSVPMPAGVPEEAGPEQTAPPVVKVGDMGNPELPNQGPLPSDTVRGPNPKDPGTGLRTRMRPDEKTNA